MRKYGRSNRQPKLTKQQVKEIRKLALTATLSQVEIGAKYNISPSQVSRIKRGKRWQHLFV